MRKNVTSTWARYAAYFLFYAALGWAIESTWLILHGDPPIRGLAYPLPLKPSYGLAGLFLAFVGRNVRNLPLWAQFVAFTVLLGALEVATGFAGLLFYGRHLWQYNGPMNFFGYTDAPHAIAWGVLGLLVTHVIHPRLAAVVRRPVRR